MSKVAATKWIGPVEIVIRVPLVIDEKKMAVAETNPLFGEISRDDIILRLAQVLDSIGEHSTGAARLLTPEEFWQKRVVPELYGPMVGHIPISLPDELVYDAQALDGEVRDRIAKIRAERAEAASDESSEDEPS